MLFAYRTSVQESLGKSPFELLFGKTPRTPPDVETLPPFHHSYPAVMGERLQEVREQASGRLRKAQHRQKLYYDARRNIASPWHPGDLVLLRLGKAPRGKSPKLSPKYEPGEYRIIDLRSQTAIVEEVTTGKQKKVSYDPYDLSDHGRPGPNACSLENYCIHLVKKMRHRRTRTRKRIR